ncbi:hypothetical protein OG786_16575 [Streptomyces sp. NBC_00101]|uniref:hypothetical protein n=1 Tax=Streptomyces sp. NBC_00101 TaxID=2975651 RepID=UPI0032498B93
MPSQPRPAAPRGFHCEHTPGESRVLALVDLPSGPSSLHAVLTCRSPELAHRASCLLQRALHVPADAWDSGPLEELCGRLPDAAGASLRTAVGHALAGVWPLSASSSPDWDESEVPTGDGSGTTTWDLSGAPDEGADGGAGRPRAPRAPVDARLADLSGPVFQIAMLREFHVHDPQALLKAAADEGWEPLPADLLPVHDRQDLIGAVLWLAERGGEIAGADTLADRSQAYRLSAEEDDEVASWTTEAVVVDFGSGWLRDAADRPPRSIVERSWKPDGPGPEGPGPERSDTGRTGRGRPDRHRVESEQPDFAALFEVGDGYCEDLECEEERCQWQLTPRTAAALHGALRLLADRARGEAEALGDRPLAPGGIGERAGVFIRLPKVTFRENAAWRRRFVRAIEDIAGDLADGWWPEPTCTAEEVALHLAVVDARVVHEAWTATGTAGSTAAGPDDDCDGVTDDPGGVLPAHRDDYDFDACVEAFFQDTDVLMLYDAGLDGVEDPEGEANLRLGIGDLRPTAWFEPFLNVTPRVTEEEYGDGGDGDGDGEEDGDGEGPTAGDRPGT